MLKYLWTVTQDLFVTVTLVTWMHAILARRHGKYGQTVHGVGIVLGVVASAALAAVKGNSNRIISSHWNHYIYAFIMGFTLCFALLSLLVGKKWCKIPLCLSGTGLSAALIFYQLPGVMLYPFNFNTMGEGYLSSYYMVRMAGWLLALLLLVAYSRMLYKCALHIRPLRAVNGLLTAGMLVNGAYCFGRFFAPWVNKARWLKWSVKYTEEQFGWIGDWMMFTAYHSMLFIWLVAALALLLLFTGFLTVVKAYDTRVVELSAPETFTEDGDRILVPMEAVNDFHLHRFEWQTPNGVNVRWIVVRKPNSASYGVGLDACEVCGNAGYYERGGVVVCRRCDVVMNTSTIGFKGGCNPIPFAYEVDGGNLVFSMADLIAGEKEFK